MFEVKENGKNERQQAKLISHSQGTFSKDHTWPLIQNNGESLEIAQSVKCLLQPKCNVQNPWGKYHA